MNWITKLGLKKEAILLDSKWYILKTFLAISTAFVLMSQVELVRHDMISVLFGLVLTLEPVNRVGMKNGLDQIFASLVGAVTTSIIVLLFGVNPISVGASVALTLYVCLLINWKSVSAVALFTAIYMTQYLQLGPDGNLSVWITLQLRFAALGSGIAVAVLYNYLFSLIQYKNFTTKRSIYLFKQLLGSLEQIEQACLSKDMDRFKQIRTGLIEQSNAIEWTAGLFSNMLKEAGGKFLSTKQKSRIEDAIALTNQIRNVSHMMFDVAFIIGERRISQLTFNQLAGGIGEAVMVLQDNLGAYKNLLESGQSTAGTFKSIAVPQKIDSEDIQRLFEDLDAMNRSIHEMYHI